MVGYSPTLYEYVFVKCDPNMERDFSYVGTVVNRFCFCVCFATVISDLITLIKIILIKRSGKQHKNFLRDVRFFCQTSVQNMTMMVALTMIVLVNNSKSPEGTVMQIFAFNTLILTHINNALALIIFNPEVRARVFRKGAWHSTVADNTNQVIPTHTVHDTSVHVSHS
uniref:7TM_GPCR_Srx domain-containing protein n=1 Tax=Steinernema glaseri TaxID=37863 RepID=A0A1I8A6G5_9BILA